MAGGQRCERSGRHTPILVRLRRTYRCIGSS
jgi:hypothetical protein